MSPDDVFKLAFIGSHGVGKTTLAYSVAARLKAHDISLEVVREVARRCPLPINEETGLASQSWILHRQISDEIVASHQYDVVICDRSILDNYTYLLLAAGPQRGLEGLIDSWMPSYDLLVHIPILDQPSADGVRSTDPGFQRAVDDRLERELTNRSLEALRLDHLPRPDWPGVVERTVLERLAPPQMELLSDPPS